MIFEVYVLKRPGGVLQKREKSCKMWDFVLQKKDWQVP